jgi:hypothetical protein
MQPAARWRPERDRAGPVRDGIAATVVWFAPSPPVAPISYAFPARIPALVLARVAAAPWSHNVDGRR